MTIRSATQSYIFRSDSDLATHSKGQYVLPEGPGIAWQGAVSMQDENELAEKYREPLTRFKPNDVKVTRSRGSVIVPWCFPAAEGAFRGLSVADFC